MKKLSVLLAVTIVLVFNLTALAQDELEERDLLEITLFGGMALPTGGISDAHNNIPGAKTGFNFGLGLGYFVKSNMVLGFDFSVTKLAADATDEADGTNHRLFTPSLSLKYYLIGESNFEPYIKAHVAVENAKFTTLRVTPERSYQAVSYDASFAYGLGLGLFYYSADYSGLYLEADYHRAATKDAKRVYDDETVVFGEDVGVINLRAGIRVLIGSGE